MSPFRSLPRRRRKMEFGPERLETRALLTGGAGDTFAIIPGTIDKPGGTAAIQFTIDPAHFTLPRHTFTLGIDVVPGPNSGLKPLITSVDDPHGNLIPQTFSSIYDPHLSPLAVASGQGTRAVLTPVSFYPNNPNKPATYVVNVTAEGNTSGTFQLDFYLPGDADGDGVVDQADLQLTRRAFGSHPGDPNFNVNADVNRDGRIGRIDLAYVQQNMGVSTTVSPNDEGSFDNSHNAGTAIRTASLGSAHPTGMATPGAMITHAQVNDKVPNTTHGRYHR
jgi:hypothetical protein